MIALLLAVVPVQGGDIAHIIFGAAPFLYLGMTWCVGFVLLGLWVRLLCDWYRRRLAVCAPAHVSWGMHGALAAHAAVAADCGGCAACGDRAVRRGRWHAAPARRRSFGRWRRARAQVALPLRHGGMGFRPVDAREADVAYLAGAALAQAAMAAGAAFLRPLVWPLRAGFEASWLAASAAASDACGALSTTMSSATSCRGRSVTSARLFDDRAGAAFLASFDVATEAGRRDAAPCAVARAARRRFGSTRCRHRRC
jgi:hypothetical protein